MGERGGAVERWQPVVPEQSILICVILELELVDEGHSSNPHVLVIYPLVHAGTQGWVQQHQVANSRGQCVDGVPP